MLTYDLPKQLDVWRIIADFIVAYSAMQCVFQPIIAIFRGELWGPSVFLAGAIILATVLFVELYFRDEADALDNG
jgi:hypothetical protein